MTPTRARTLVVVALGCGLAAWAVLRVVYLSLPPLPWTAAPTLLLLAIVEAASGRSLRIRLRGNRGRDAEGNPGKGSRPPGWQSPRPVPPITVARLAALAKASSLAGAVFGGLAAGALVYLAASLAKPMPRQDALAAAGTLGGAILLVVAALYLEYGCRARPPRDEDEDHVGS